MKIEVNSSMDDLPLLLPRLAEFAVLPLAEEIVSDFAKSIRRTRGRYAMACEEVSANQAELLDAFLDKISLQVRNYVLFGLMTYWPLDTFVYIRFWKDGSSPARVSLIVTNEKPAPTGYSRLT